METRKLIVKVNAKVNLSLNISGVQNGMHILDTVVASTDIADVITVTERKDNDLNVKFSHGRFGKDNTVVRAVQAMRGEFGEVGGFDIFVEKNIPVASGLGGSSADAAGVMRAIDVMYGLGRKYNHNEYALASKVGSDVPFMLHGGFARLFDVGSRVMSFESMTDLNFVIAQCKTGVLSADAYKKFDELNPDKTAYLLDNAFLVEALKNEDLETAISCTGNVLTEAACALNPEIATTLAALDSVGAKRSVMTGSGSACIGYFEDFDGAFRGAAKMRAQGFSAEPHVSLKQGVQIIRVPSM